MSRSLPGIATTYQGRVYRSRLEARYAAFFDALDWSHEYEPFDLHGYVPDFVLHPNGVEPVVVEVKPFTPPFESEEVVMTCRRIVDGGWTGPALVVGAQHLIASVDPDVVHTTLLDADGLVRHAPPISTKSAGSTVCIGRMRDDGSDVWRAAYIAREHYLDADKSEHDVTDDWFITHDEHEAVLDRTDFFTLRTAWATAGNVTQWKAPSR